MANLTIRQSVISGVLAGLLSCGQTLQAAPLEVAAPAQTAQKTAEPQSQSTYRGAMEIALAALARGNPELAARFARDAFKLANNKAERSAAARIVASALFRSENYTRSEWWLRRALQNAPDAAAQAAVSADFAVVRQKNPLSVQLSFSLAPNNNVNNGSTSETVTIFNLPFLLSADARALAGTEIAASASLSYRLSESANHATFVGVSLYGRSYKLSKNAEAAAPGVRGSDYAFAMTELSLTHKRRFAGSSGPTSFGLTLGRNWYGRDPYTRYGRLSIGQEYRVAPDTAVSLYGNYDHQVSIRDGNLPSEIFTVGTAISHRLSNRDAVSVSLQLQETSSDGAILENRAWRTNLRYSFGRPVLGANLSLSASAEKRDYAFSIYDPAGRHDLSFSVGATAILSNLSYFGFSPLVALEAGRTNSNVGLYDRKSSAIRFGIQSNF